MCSIQGLLCHKGNRAAVWGSRAQEAGQEVAKRERKSWGLLLNSCHLTSWPRKRCVSITSCVPAQSASACEMCQGGSSWFFASGKKDILNRPCWCLVPICFRDVLKAQLIWSRIRVSLRAVASSEGITWQSFRHSWNNRQRNGVSALPQLENQARQPSFLGLI